MGVLKNLKGIAKVAMTTILALPLIPGLVNAEGTSTDFGYTGGYQQWTAPQTGRYQLEVWGAQGGGSDNCGNPYQGAAGRGGSAQGEVYLNAGETLYIYVGGQGGCSSNGLAQGGWNGGGSAYASQPEEPGGGGGGATDIRRINGSWDDYSSLNSRIIVAGGGGGGGEDTGDQYGDGGGLEGSNGWYPANQFSAGDGGGFGFGGSTGYGDGGGGGGGWYGGGATYNDQIGWDSQGGGGGSAYLGGVTNGSTQTGVNSGNGYARIAYIGDTNATLTSISVNQRSVYLPVNNQNQIIVTAHYSDGSSRDITGIAAFKSSNTYVVSTGSNGWLTGLNPGQSDVSITYKEKISTGKTLTVTSRVKVTVGY
ncbi:glycine rich protein [Neobacillus bataviensis]|uniref:receptor protein-tyrosine kinase n=1 Tax=Neobacillus bataviensis TaxID=220685 RepID=A0A561CH61_9BACI|nr:glycine-rich protein [Neobacillus bataviensis]TWD90238.1 glycine rich protein [Neobacillus bataviensis]